MYRCMRVSINKMSSSSEIVIIIIIIVAIIIIIVVIATAIIFIIIVVIIIIVIKGHKQRGGTQEVPAHFVSVDVFMLNWLPWKTPETLGNACWLITCWQTCAG